MFWDVKTAICGSSPIEHMTLNAAVWIAVEILYIYILRVTYRLDSLALLVILGSKRTHLTECVSENQARLLTRLRLKLGFLLSAYY